MVYQLRVGFDQSTPEDQAIGEAVAEWFEACDRAGRTPAGDPTTRVVRDDRERSELGEYVVEVTGRRSGDGDV
ncbi:MAG: hypothetical protein ACM30G_08220 [Micromonosporaceae bacterium]